MLYLETLENRLLLSITITDSSPANDDFAIDFADTGVGRAAEESVTITNDGSSTVHISQLDLSDDTNFSLVSVAAPQTPPGCDAEKATKIELGVPFLNGQWVSAHWETAWYYFDAEEGYRIDVTTEDTSMQIVTVDVYNPYGDIVASGDDFYQRGFREYIDGFYTLSAGRYYLAVTGAYQGGAQSEVYQVHVNATARLGNMAPPVFTLPAVGETITFSDSLDRKESLQLAPDHDTDWIQFEVPAGRNIYGKEFNVEILADSVLDYEVYDHNGNQIDTAKYSTPGTPQSLNFVCYGGNLFTVVVQSRFTGSENINFTLGVTETSNSIFDIEPGESSEIKVWFAPQNASPLAETLTIATNAEGGTSDIITLNGNAIGPDITIGELSLPGLAYPSYVQSGQALTASVVVSNASSYNNGALVLNQPILQFYLSEDGSLDTAKDTLLTTTVPVLDSFPMHPGSDISLNCVVDIPAIPADSYCLFALVNGDKAISEWTVSGNNYINDQTYAYAINVDPYNALVLDSSGNQFDYRINYGTKAIGYNLPQQTVTVYNRGNSPVSITDWSLASGVDFVLDNKNASGNSADDIILQPGQSRDVLLRFVSDQFGSGGQSVFNDVLTVHTGETVYQVDLTGKIVGDDVLVLENSGTVNDGLLEPGVVSVNTPVTEKFSLKNNGNQTLHVNSITFADGAMSLLKLAQDPLKPLVLPFNLAPGQSMELAVVLTAPDHRTGDYSDSIIIHSTDNNGDYICQLDVSATITRYDLGIYETSDIANDAVLRFGSHSPQQPEPITETLQLRNDGLADLTISGFVFGGSNFIISSAQLFGQAGLIADVNVSAGNIVLAPYASSGDYLNLEIQCVAKTQGAFADTLTVSSQAGSDTIAMSCQIADGQLILTDSSDTFIDAAHPLTLDTVVCEYGNTSLATSNWFYLYNTGNVNINLTSITIAGAGFTLSTLDSADVQTGTIITFDASQQVLLPGAKTRVAVNFDGSSLIKGLYQGSITVNSSLADALSFNVITSITIPDIKLTSNSIDFGSGGAVNIGETSTSQLLISNIDGTADLIIDDWTSSNGQFAMTVDIPLVIPAGQSCNVQVVYTPTIPGSVQAALTINSNDPDSPAVVVALAGTSDGRPLEVSGNSYSFHDADGDLVRLSLSDGNMVIYLEGGKLDYADVALLELSNTTSKSQLRISSSGQTDIAAISDVTSTGGLASISAPDVNLGQSLLINGSLGSLTLKNIKANAAVTVLKPAAKAMSIKADQIAENVAFNLQSNVKTFQANSFISGSLSAVAIDQVKIAKGTFGADLNATTINKITSQGDITGDINTTGSINSIASTRGGIKQNTISVGDNIKTIKAATDISSHIIVQNDIDSIDVKYGSFSGAVRARNMSSMNAGALDSALISTANDIDTIKVKFDIIDSNILAGYDIGMSSNLLDVGDDNLNEGHINLISFGGDYRNSYVTAGAMTDNIYINLYSSLHSGREHSAGNAGIAKIQGKNIVSGNDNTEFGFYASGNIGTLLAGSADFVVAENYNPDSQA